MSSSMKEGKKFQDKTFGNNACDMDTSKTNSTLAGLLF